MIQLIQTTVAAVSVNCNINLYRSLNSHFDWLALTCMLIILVAICYKLNKPGFKL